jgi:outer membrane immunogenic protein
MATAIFAGHPNATAARILRGTGAELFNDGLARLPRAAWVGYDAVRIGVSMEIGAMRSKIVSLLAVAFSLGFAQVASAADMPVKARPMTPPPVVYNWTGCYIGANAGGNWGRSSSVENGASPTPSVSLSDDVRLSGGLVGGTLGCNYQPDPRWVIGIELDADWTSKKGSQPLGTAFSPGYINEVKEDWIGTARGRLGYLVTNPWMVYVTGGGAWARVKQTEYLASNPSLTGATNSTTATVWGWTVGVGTEYMLDPNWSVKGEFLYVDLGTHSFLNPGFALANAAPVDTRVRDYIARIGVNYKFWTGH